MHLIQLPLYGEKITHKLNFSTLLIGNKTCVIHVRSILCVQTAITHFNACRDAIA